MNKPTSNTFWLLKMAWRESRTHRVKLALFLSAIVIGVAAQVSISSLRDNLTQSIDNQSKELLGADLEVRHTAPFDTVLNGFLERRFDESADMVRFASMASAEDVKNITGYTIGGVSPIGHLKKIEILIDKSLSRFNLLFAAAGHPNCVFKIDFTSLIKITNGHIEEITE